MNTFYVLLSSFLNTDCGTDFSKEKKASLCHFWPWMSYVKQNFFIIIIIIISIIIIINSTNFK